MTHNELKLAIYQLLNNEVINENEFLKLTAKLCRVSERKARAARQEEVNAEVEVHLMMITPGELFKHRKVWEAAGREVYTRDEISKALQAFKASGLVEQVRKGPNNFQVFWTRCGAESAESSEEV
jgi:hypothetical protein